MSSGTLFGDGCIETDIPSSGSVFADVVCVYEASVSEFGCSVDAES